MSVLDRGTQPHFESCCYKYFSPHSSIFVFAAKKVHFSVSIFIFVDAKMRGSLGTVILLLQNCFTTRFCAVKKQT